MATVNRSELPYVDFSGYRDNHVKSNYERELEKAWENKGITGSSNMQAVNYDNRFVMSGKVLKAPKLEITGYLYIMNRRR
jgi:hypothetical protein